MRCLLCAFMFLAVLPAAAQEPILRMDFPEAEAIPGQPLSLRLTVLAPTFLPNPPVWPSFEAPNLLVRVGASGPVSERIEGATWAGVSRRYVITPMVPGSVTLASQDVTVTWADPETGAPRRIALITGPLSVAGILPEGAEELDPFIAANELQLRQTIDGETETMTPGDSVIRTVTATIRGSSPIFLPALLPVHDIDGLRAYPDAPVVEVSEERGVTSGVRTERVTLVAEGGGAGKAPAVSLDWFNLTTERVETASLDAVALSVSGPPAAREAADAPRDWRALILTGLAGLLCLALLLAVLRRLVPRVTRLASLQRQKRRASESYAYRSVIRTLRACDQSAVYPALDLWAERLPGPDPRSNATIATALAQLGAARYGSAEGDGRTGWRALAHALPGARRMATADHRRSALPPLNPGA